MSRLTALPRRAESVQPQILSSYRAVVALLFVCHGARSLFGVLGATGSTTRFLDWPSWYAAMIELVAGALVLIGLFTRPAALLCSGSMAYAYFTVHQEKALWPIQNGGEASAMFCWAFLLVAAFGPGRYAVDGLLRRGRDSAPVLTIAAEPEVGAQLAA
jgi:putative oxidoreductase